MLQDLNLDNEMYDEIMDEAKNVIISLYPEWTDYNHHDPGITLLELFSMVKESQQYYLNQIGINNRKKYLKLLGGTTFHKRPSSTLVRFYAKEDLHILQGTKLAAADTIFETVEEKNIFPEDVKQCFAVAEGTVQDFFDREQIDLGHKMKFYPFGERTQVGNVFYIGLETPLLPKVEYDLYIQILSAYPVKRNLPNEGFIPLAELNWEFYTPKGWRSLPIKKDETFGLIHSGFLKIMMDRKMELLEEDDRKGYFIRATLTKDEYDVSPEINYLSFNVVLAMQKDTLSEYTDIKIPLRPDPNGKKIRLQEDGTVCLKLDTDLAANGFPYVFLGKEDCFLEVFDYEKEVDPDSGETKLFINNDLIRGNDVIRVVNMDSRILSKKIVAVADGFPELEIDLEDHNILYDRFEIMVEDEFMSRSVDTREGEKVFRQWEKTQDFGSSGPQDRHYILDTDHGKIYFGNCINGMAPEGEILLIGYANTLGKDGNVKEGKINSFFSYEGMNITMENITRGEKGRNEETLDEAFYRVRKELKTPLCLVTAKDYEEEIKRTPGLMIETCQVISNQEMMKFTKNIDEMAIHAVVRPYSLNTKCSLSPAYGDNISKHLEKSRMIGSQVRILSPEYIDVDVYLDVVINPHFRQAQEELEKNIRGYFEKYKNNFGFMVNYGRFYAEVERMECIKKVRSLQLEGKGFGVRRTKEGDLVLPPNGLIRIDQVRYFVSMGE